MRRIKHILITSACIILVFIATACGGEGPAPEPAEPTPAPESAPEPVPAPEQTPETIPEPEPAPAPDSTQVTKPAEFEVERLVASPSGMITGESSQVTVDVTNTGGLEGDYEVVFKIDGSVAETKKLTLAAGVTETVNFTVTMVQPGTYNLTVNELSETLTVIVIPSTTVEIIYDIEYGRVGDIPLLLDIYVPETRINSPTPAIVCIHGGWGTLNKDDSSFIDMFDYLAAHGFVVVSINHRLRTEAPWPAQVEDSKCAVRWLRANADEYDIDPDRIGVWGVSSGGYLAAMVGLVDETARLEGNGGWEDFSSSVKAICTYTGSYDWVWTPQRDTEEPGDLPPPPPKDLPPPSGDSPLVFWLGGERDEVPEKYEAASATSYVNAGDPPLLIICGDMDYAFANCEYMVQTCMEAGIDAALVTVTGAGHALAQATDEPISPSLDEIEELRLNFFIRHLLLSG